jgi:hypothetical protein
VREEHGALRSQTRAVRRGTSGEPAVGLLLQTRLPSDPDEAVAAAGALGRFGTDDARHVVGALQATIPTSLHGSERALLA